MGITAISRDWGAMPSTVRITTTDSLSTAQITGYLATQISNILMINHGIFEWSPSDSIILSASDGSGIFEISTDFNSLLPYPGESSGPYLLKSANLSDVSSVMASYTNLGLGSGIAAHLVDANFSGGVLTLTNPCPNIFVIECSTPGNNLRLPPAQGAEAFTPSQGPLIIIPAGFESINVYNNSGGMLIETVDSPSNMKFYLVSNMTINGNWLPVSSVSTLNSLSGDLTLVGGTNVTITPNADGEISISAVESGGFVWVDQTTNSATLVPFTGYVTDAASLVTYTLPSVCPFGSVFEIQGKSADGWIVNTAGGQTIQFGDVTASTSISSTLQYDYIRLVCITANTTFAVTNAFGNLDYV